LTTHTASEYYDYEVDAAIGSARAPFSGDRGVLVSGQPDRIGLQRAAWLHNGLLSGGAVLPAGLAPALWLIGVMIDLAR
jgi:hypothetical protein